MEERRRRGEDGESRGARREEERCLLAFSFFTFHFSRLVSCVFCVIKVGGYYLLDVSSHVTTYSPISNFTDGIANATRLRYHDGSRWFIFYGPNQQ